MVLVWHYFSVRLTGVNSWVYYGPKTVIILCYVLFLHRKLILFTSDLCCMLDCHDVMEVMHRSRTFYWSISVAHFTFKLTMSIHVQFSLKRCIVMLKTIQKMMLYTNKAYLWTDIWFTANEVFHVQCAKEVSYQLSSKYSAMDATL